MRVTGGWVFTIFSLFQEPDTRKAYMAYVVIFPASMDLFGAWAVTKLAFPFWDFLYRAALPPPPGDPRPPEPRAGGLRLPRYGGFLGKSAAGAFFFIGVSNVNLRPQPWKNPCGTWQHGISTNIPRPIWPTNYLLKHSKIWEASLAFTSPRPSWQVASFKSLWKSMMFGGIPLNVS